MGRHAEAAVLVFAGGLIALWWLHPLAGAFLTHLIDPGGGDPLKRADLYLITWVLAWDSHALLHQPFDLFQANIFYPAPMALAFSEHFLGLVPLFAPTFWLTSNPILAMNLMTVLAYPLRALSLFLWLRPRVSREAAWLGAVVFAFVAGSRASIGRIDVESTFYLVFAFVFLDRFLRNARLRDALGLATMLFLQAAVSVYLAFATFFGFGIYLVIALAAHARGIDARRLAGIAIAGITALAGMVLISWPYLELNVESGFSSPSQTPTEALKALGTSWTAIHVRRFFGETISPVSYFLMFLAFLPGRGARGQVRTAATALIVLGAILASGPRLRLFGVELWTPYTFLIDALPGFSTIRAPQRFLVLSGIGIGMLAGIGAGRGLSWLRPSRRLPLVAVVAGLHLLAVQPDSRVLIPPPAGRYVPEVHRWLAEHGEGLPVMELPRPWRTRAAARMLQGTAHFLPMVDGYSGYPPEADQVLHDLAEGLPATAALRALVDAAEPGWIIVRTHEFAEQNRELWPSGSFPGLEEVRAFGSDRLFRVTMSRNPDAPQRLLSRSDSLHGVPKDDLGPACSGRLKLLRSEKRPGWQDRYTFTVRIENHDGQDWPGVGGIALGLVRARICFDRGRRCAGEGARLRNDIPAGGHTIETLPARIALLQKGAPIRIELFQSGGPELADCGVSPLIVRAPNEDESPDR
jgi:hypothetical protein